MLEVNSDAMLATKFEANEDTAFKIRLVFFCGWRQKERKEKRKEGKGRKRYSEIEETLGGIKGSGEVYMEV